MTWEPVQGWPYEVHPRGLVRNARTGRVLTPWPNGNGYLKVRLYDGPRQKVALVHRLVAGAFMRPCQGASVVHHHNHERTDNRLVNLVWTTYAGNRRH